jgi:enoyl-CoA hydratase/carnithine racemase
MSTESLLEVEERDGITIIDIHAPERGLALTTPAYMDEFWTHLHRVAVKKQRVLILISGKDSFAPARVDEAWEDISNAATSGDKMPPQILALLSNTKKLIEYHRASRTLCIGAFSGAIDIDMFGLLAFSHYRICTADTMIENRTIDRDAHPGIASIWFLSRVVGFARAAEIFLEQDSFTASEARDLRLVNAVAPTDELRSFATEKAEYFASKSPLALSSIVAALNHAHQPLQDYLDQVGNRFSAAT